MKKKVLAVLLAVTMVFGMTACGEGTGNASGGEEDVSGAENTEERSQDSTEESGTQSEEEGSGTMAADISEAMDISVWLFADDYKYYSTYDQNPVVSWWAEKFNMNLEFQQPPVGSEAEQLTTMMGTGDYTDFFDVTYYNDSLATLCDDGEIWDLAPYIEQYMPNYLAYLEKEGNGVVRASVYDDDGRTFIIPVINDMEPIAWGGLVYRRDILETMTGGNIAFPSGNDIPTTVADWDYMLPLMKMYFDAAGMEKAACLILPANGYFPTGELITGFGISGREFLREDGTVDYGLATPEFYNYLKKMNEWYEAGYIYKDFSGRTQDPFYLPDPSLTYSGAAGIWYGMLAQLNTKLSQPEYGLNMMVRPMAAPIDEEHGITAEMAGNRLYTGRGSGTSGWAASKNCSEEKLIRMLTALDYFFSDEGAVIRTMGISTDEGAAENEVLAGAGFPNGTKVAGENAWTEEIDVSTEDYTVLDGNRLPGRQSDVPSRQSDFEDGVNLTADADGIWAMYGQDNVYPAGVTNSVEEAAENSVLMTRITDYANSQIPQFIMGRIELTEESYQAYVDEMYGMGLQDYLDNKTAAYQRYLDRMK